MNSFIHADIFFIISAVGFCLLAILGAIALVYLILILARVQRMSKKIEAGMESITDDAKAFFMSLRESRIFSWLFGPKKHRRKGE